MKNRFSPLAKGFVLLSLPKALPFFRKNLMLLFGGVLALVALMANQKWISQKDTATIEAKIIEVGEAEVKYKLFTQPDGVTFVMDASLIKKIVMANGAVHKFEEGGSIDNKEYYEGQHKNAYKGLFPSECCHLLLLYFVLGLCI